MSDLLITKMLVPASKYAIKCPYTMVPEEIVVHNTYNNASAMNEIAYMISNNKYISFHAAVDYERVVQGIEFNRNSFNAGDGAKGRGNRKGIAVEICYSKSGGYKFNKAEDNAAKYIAMILKQYGWGINKVKKHQDYSNKYCPHRTLDMGWDRFVKKVKAYLNGGIVVEKPKAPSKPAGNGNTSLFKDQVFNLNEIGKTSVHFPGIFKVKNVSASLNAVTATTLLKGNPYSFNWIDAAPLTKVDSKGKKLPNQVLNVGDYFIFPKNNKYLLLGIDVATSAVKVKVGKREVWVKADPLKEV